MTHHLEEIPPAFTHALVLNGGQVAASGPIEETVTSEILSTPSPSPYESTRSEGSFTARLA